LYWSAASEFGFRRNGLGARSREYARVTSTGGVQNEIPRQHDARAAGRGTGVDASIAGSDPAITASGHSTVTVMVAV
jgi:hypothetical protein